MFIADPELIRGVREMVDQDIARIHIEEDTPRQLAYMNYAHEELETYVDISCGPSGWLAATAIEGSGYYAFQGPVERVATGYLSAREAARWELQYTAIGRCPETVELASIIRVVDPEVDIGMSSDRFVEYYGWTAILQLIDDVAPPMCEHCRELLAGPSLFDLDFDARLALANAEIRRERRTLMGHWAHYAFGIEIDGGSVPVRGDSCNRDS